MKFDAIQLHSAPEALAQQIVAQIESGELKPGSCLPSQRRLAKILVLLINLSIGATKWQKILRLSLY